MKIALDYDGTYTADPELWNKFIANAVECGHDVFCVTMRNALTELILFVPMKVYYTNRQAKMDYCKTNGIKVDIWIDDKPGWIFDDAPSREGLI